MIVSLHECGLNVVENIVHYRTGEGGKLKFANAPGKRIPMSELPPWICWSILATEYVFITDSVLPLSS